MALTAYQTATKLLLQSTTNAAGLLYTDANLTTWINTARGQLSGEAECIRNYATLALTAGTRQYNFSTVTLGSPSTGIQGILRIQQALAGVGSGLVMVYPRPFPYFTLYALNNPVPVTGLPTMWSQFGQGVNGTIFVDPVPDQAYTLTLDTVCYPIPLVDNSTAESIPYPWTDAIPYFAAYYAFMSAQRPEDAKRMYQMYEQFVQRARTMSNPDVLPYAYVQTPDQTMPNKLGVQPSGGGQ